MTKIIALILIFSGIIMRFSFVKNNLIKTIGWAISSLGWLMVSIISLIDGNVLFAVLALIFFVGDLFFGINNIKEIKNGNNN